MGLVIQEPQGSIAQLWPAKGASPGAAFTRTSSSSLCVRRGIPGPARPSIQTEAAVNGVSEARGPRQRGPTIAAGQGHPGTPEPHRITDLLQGFRMLQACGASVIEGAYRYLHSLRLKVRIRLLLARRLKPGMLGLKHMSLQSHARCASNLATF